MSKNCNGKKEFQNCIHCNSRDDPECARNETLKTSEVCKNYLGTCVTGIDAHGETHRRCSKDYSHDSIEFPNGLLHVCSENDCNTNIFPSDRLHCYQCNGEKECDFQSSDGEIHLKPQPCAIYSDFDQCFAYLSKDFKIHRGCLTDPSEERLLCDQQMRDGTKQCVKCEGSGCNNVPKVSKPKLSCVQCDKSEKCAFGQDETQAVTCEKNVTFGHEESCYTHFDVDEGWAERGCTLDGNLQWDENDENVNVCTKSSCNTDNILHTSCLSCKSNLTGNCATIDNPENYFKICQGNYHYDRRGCCTMVKNETVRRGCIKTLSKKDYESCQNDKANCYLCTDHNCNIYRINSSPSRLTLSTLAFGLLLLLTFVRI